MIFYFEHFKELKKKKKFSTNTLCEVIGVHRATIWNWENGKKIPSEQKIRKLAELLNVPISEISDLKPEYAKSKFELTEIIDPWLQFADENSREVYGKFNKYLSMIQIQHQKLQKSTVISQALLSSIESVLYIKDKNNKYITANRVFRNILLLNNQYDISGKSDIDFFSANEARSNSIEDQSILQTGIALKNIERRIPGSRRKKIGLVSKIPILDPEKKIIGLIANYIDITERVEASQQRKLLEKAINNIEDCIWIAKGHDKNPEKIDFLFLNDAVGKFITGINSKKNDFRLYQKQIEEKFRIKKLISSKTEKYPITFEYKEPAKDKEITKETTIRQKIFYDEEEKIFLGIVEDITKSRKNREVRVLLEKILGKSHDIVWIRESPPSNKLLYVSKSVIDMYGYSPAMYYNDTEFWYNNCAHPDDKKLLLEYRNNKNWPQRKIHKIITKNKKTRWIETSILKSNFLDKQCIAYIERDVTERIEEEKSLITSIKREIALSLKDKGVKENIIKDVTGFTL